MVLNPDIDNVVLDKIYFQIADYILQLSQLTFIRIGAISKDNASNTWSVTKRPLTYNMNELASVAGYPDNQFPTTPFESASGYFKAVADEHLTHLWTQRNLADLTHSSLFSGGTLMMLSLSVVLEVEKFADTCQFNEAVEMWRCNNNM